MKLQATSWQETGQSREETHNHLQDAGNPFHFWLESKPAELDLTSTQSYWIGGRLQCHCLYLSLNRLCHSEASISKKADKMLIYASISLPRHLGATSRLDNQATLTFVLPGAQFPIPINCCHQTMGCHNNRVQPQQTHLTLHIKRTNLKEVCREITIGEADKWQFDTSKRTRPQKPCHLFSFNSLHQYV